MGQKGRHNIKKPKKISFLAKGVEPNVENLKEIKPIKVAFLSKIKKKGGEKNEKV